MGDGSGGGDRDCQGVNEEEGFGGRGENGSEEVGI